MTSSQRKVCGLFNGGRQKTCSPALLGLNGRHLSIWYLVHLYESMQQTGRVELTRVRLHGCVSSWTSGLNRARGTPVKIIRFIIIMHISKELIMCWTIFLTRRLQPQADSQSQFAEESGNKNKHISLKR